MTPNEARQAVFKGQGPAGIHRIDPPHLPGEEWHAHLAPGAGSIAINRDGTWRHLPSGQKPPITPARKFRMLLHINPTRQRGKRTGSLARAF